MATHSSILAWRIPMDRGAWWATVHRFVKSWIQVSINISINIYQPPLYSFSKEILEKMCLPKYFIWRMKSPNIKLQ